ncbi:MAG: TonB-dependent receptor [Bdellovibrionaceae bacterium]|nr:TonB-dependent receptor [Pseudobdellovibrionaceae bacterium]
MGMNWTKLWQTLKKNSLIPLFAMGMNYQVQSNTPAFFDASPSNDEIDASVLDERQNVNPVEALKSLAGISLLGTEVTTYPASLFMRGADADHTLFLWNDLRSDNFTGPNGATDPFSFGNEFSNRIKILKGPQSLLYGSQALGGVVLIDEDPDLSSSAELMGGSLNSSKALAEVRARGEGWRLAVGGSAFVTDGVSSVRGAETDGRYKSSATAILNYDLANSDEIQVLVNTSREKTSYDLPPRDDVNANTENRSSQWKLRYKADWSDTSESIFLLSGQDLDRDNRNPADAQNADFYIDQSRGQRQSFLNRNNFVMAGSLWHVGYEHNQEQGSFFNVSNLSVASSFRPELRDDSVYLVNDWRFENSDLAWGARGTCEDGKDCLGVYQLSYQYHWRALQRSVYGVLSTGLKRPTMYQLYSAYGDRALSSESSQALEVGFVQRSGTSQKFRVSLFENRFADLIDYDFIANKSKNTKRAKNQGIELAHEFDAVFGDAQISLALINAKNEVTGQSLLRRPTFQASWNAGFHWTESFRLGSELNYVNDRDDIDTGGVRVRLPSFVLWNAVILYKWLGVSYFLRVNNVTATDYEEISGYQTPGRFYWTGAKVTF